MTGIRKSAAAPAILLGAGVVARDALILQAQGGAVKFDFDAKLYGHSEVKRALIRNQNDKCAFCESWIRHISFGDVEHFRPKAGYIVGSRLLRPGYFWLAYEWSNLYLSCEVCNRRHKGNLFPIAGRRARYDHPDLSAERPRFVDPGVDEPGAHIEFLGAVPHGKTIRGRETVRSLGLNREELNGVRRERLQQAVLLLEGLEINLGDTTPRVQAHVRKVLRQLCELTKPASEYSAMYKALIERHPLAPRILAACP